MTEENQSGKETKIIKNKAYLTDHELKVLLISII